MADEVFINSLLDNMLKSQKWGPALRDLFTWHLQRPAHESEIEMELDVVSTLDSAATYLRNRSTDWLSLFRRLQDASYGELKLGRRGHKTRFIWREPPSALAHEALLRIGGKPLGAPSRPGKEAVPQPVSEVAHPFPLRHDWTVYVRVPSDVTREELNRLAEFTKLLPV